MKTITAAAILLSACATTATTTSTLPSDRTGMTPVIDPANAAPSDDATAWFPALQSPAALPSAARHQRELSTQSDRFDLTVRVCVAPDGTVQDVQLAQPSGSATLDRAVQQDVAGWRYERFAAPAHIRVCKPLALAYEPAAERSAVRIPLVRLTRR